MDFFNNPVTLGVCAVIGFGAMIATAVFKKLEGGLAVAMSLIFSSATIGFASFDIAAASGDEIANIIPIQFAGALLAAGIAWLVVGFGQFICWID